jgi:hypothetical protein
VIDASHASNAVRLVAQLTHDNLFLALLAAARGPPQRSYRYGNVGVVWSIERRNAISLARFCGSVTK